MNADIYRTRAANAFLLVPQGSTLEHVPQEILIRVGPLAVFLNTRDLSEPLLRRDASEIKFELASQGFSVRLA